MHPAAKSNAPKIAPTIEQNTWLLAPLHSRPAANQIYQYAQSPAMTPYDPCFALAAGCMHRSPTPAIEKARPYPAPGNGWMGPLHLTISVRAVQVVMILALDGGDIALVSPSSLLLLLHPSFIRDCIHAVTQLISP
ncbi:uncharacterized protein N7459_008322 [Penicillium hispanicum]|uniref:uncharacterized protein n=1 Tax=Penicillium hispanicum TaxID=1080232 RepID=UPI00254171C8|nr:uncharacterized protein N7459_008322 [Penicillium hispanicum]KAJ5573895.1 hypothetical protein N7459_008322 [Penicillium hispanicum]